MNTKYTPGNLITYRNRDWMILPSADKDILLIKPLGASDEEITGVFLPLAHDEEKIEPATFSEPTIQQIGRYETAKLLFDASRLSLRNAAGPFRAMAKLSFQPRAYQVVPLVMALKQDVTRLLIADDVGIGKTIEALLIVKELLERGEIRRFAVICPPHLCEQWQNELKSKLDMDAEIIRSSTAARLDRMIYDDRSVFAYVPYQVISIDYIKSDKRMEMFINDCPEMVIVDEAHTCALPQGAKSKNQQLRHRLISRVAEDSNRHFIMLTATPHSGKDDEFLSLLGLLKPEFRNLNFEDIEQKEREHLAKYFIQRKRENVKRWMNEETLFPDRDSKEIGFNMSSELHSLYKLLVNFGRSISDVRTGTEATRLLRSWAAIALIKGAMSSPAMAVEMLERRKEKLKGTTDDISVELVDENSIKDTLFEENDFGVDFARTDILDSIDYEDNELKQLEELIHCAKSLKNNIAGDTKLKQSINLIKGWIKEGFQPIIFCHYITTAKYVSESLERALPKTIDVRAITSEMGDEQRKEAVESMGKSEKRVLVATDCLSEGINLQDHFDAVLHYDLPWNPNRIEQREGRVDRFGQSSPIVKSYMIYGEDNPMDSFILEVLIRKVRDIQRSIGVTISIGENNKSLMAEITNKILYSSQSTQLTLFQDDQVRINADLERAREKGVKLRSIFAHESVKPELIKKDLIEVNEAIGDMNTVDSFIRGALDVMGVIYRSTKEGLAIQLTNLKPHLKVALLTKEEQTKNIKEVLISFDSPTPKKYRYIGRNHKFVEQVAHYLLAQSFEGGSNHSLARTTVVQVEEVTQKTVLVMFRVRNVVKEVKANIESVAEEMFLWGYRETENGLDTLAYNEAKDLLITATPVSNLSYERQIGMIEDVLHSFENKKDEFIKIASKRADKLVEAHGRFKSLIGGRSYESSTPILPPDIMGVYILLPNPKQLKF